MVKIKEKVLYCNQDQDVDTNDDSSADSGRTVETE